MWAAAAVIFKMDNYVKKKFLDGQQNFFFFLKEWKLTFQKKKETETIQRWNSPNFLRITYDHFTKGVPFKESDHNVLSEVFVFRVPLS